MLYQFWAAVVSFEPLWRFYSFCIFHYSQAGIRQHTPRDQMAHSRSPYWVRHPIGWDMALNLRIKLRNRSAAYQNQNIWKELTALDSTSDLLKAHHCSPNLPFWHPSAGLKFKEFILLSTNLLKLSLNEQYSENRLCPALHHTTGGVERMSPLQWYSIISICEINCWFW